MSEGASLTSRASAAQAQVRQAWDDPSRLLVVHYDCSPFDEAKTEPPAVRFIAVKQLEPRKLLIFGDPRKDELKELQKFGAFARHCGDKKLWVNCNMRDEPFGFEAIARRHDWHLRHSSSAAPLSASPAGQLPP